MANEIDPIIVEVGFKEDASIQDVMTHLTTVKSTMEDISSVDGKPSVSSMLDTLGLSEDNKTDVSRILQSAYSTLQGLGSNLLEVPSHLQSAFSVLKSELTSIESLLNNTYSHYDKIGKNSTKDLQTAQTLMMSIASIQGVNKSIQESNSLFSNPNLGWDVDTFMRYAPHIARDKIEPAVRAMRVSNKHGTTSEGIINSLMSSPDVTGMIKHLMKEEGVDIQRDDIDSILEENLKALVQSYTPHGIASSTVDTLRRWRGTERIKTLKTAATPQERLANDYQREAFNTYGQSPETIKEAANYIRTHGGNPLRGFATKKEREQSGLQDFYDYISQGNNAAALFPLLHEAGIITDGGKHDRYQAYPKIKETQLQYLLARTLQEYNNALDSDPVYGIDSTNIVFSERAAGRQGKQPSLYLGLANTLKDVIPSIEAMEPGTTGSGKLFETGIQYGKAPSPDRYYIPQTTVDFSTGQAEVRDLNWKKPLDKGIEERDDDELVAITDSIGARMFGLKGNRTLALGRDEKTGEIIRTNVIEDRDHNGRKRKRGLPILTADFGSLITTDENGRYVVDKDSPDYQRAVNILEKKENLKYGGEEYTYLAQHENGSKIVFGNTKMMKDLNDIYKEAHLPTPFGYGEDSSTPGFFQDDPTTTMKVANYMAKMFSSGTPIEELYPESTKDLKNKQGIYANFEMMYDILGIDKDTGRRMDGLVFGDPRYFKKDMQARYGLGTAKFMLTAQDWRPMLEQGFAASAKENPRLFYEDKSGKHILAPTGGASEEDRPAIEAYIKGTPYIDRSGRKWTEDELREQYFVDILRSDAPWLMDRSAVKAPTGFRTLSTENYKGRYGKPAYDVAVKQGRVDTKTGQVRLLPYQQQDVLQHFSNEFDKSISGFVEMKDEENLSSKKRYMPESILRAIGVPPELFEESDRRYKEKLDELNTTAGRIKQFEGDEASMEKIRNNPAWVWESKEANTHIEETRRALEYHRAVHDVLMHEDRETVPAVGTVGQLAEIYQGFTKIPNKEYGKFQAMLPSVMEKNNAVWSKGISAEEIDMLGRFPFASGQYLMDVKNIAQIKEVDQYLDDLDAFEETEAELKKAKSRKNPDLDKIQTLTKKRDDLQIKVADWNKKITDNPEGALSFASALRENKRDPRLINSMIMTASQMYTMNTGDFDGDTVNAFIHMGELAETRMKVKENARRNKEEFEKGMAIARQANKGSVEPPNPELKNMSEGELKLLNLAQNNNATTAMAQASAALRKAQSAPEDTPGRVAAIVEAMTAYDFATSDVKKKAATFTMGGHAYDLLNSQGQHYERFVRSLYKARNAQNPDEDYGRNIFAVSPASMSDPEGIFRMATTKMNLDKAGIMDLSSLELMENWYDRTFGVEQTAESKAARFYLDKMEDNLIWSRLWSNKDVRTAMDLHKKWGSELDAKRTSGNYSTTQLDEEQKRYEAFGKRIDELNSGKFATVSAVSKEASKYREMALENPGMASVYNKYADYMESLLPKDEKAKTEADKVRDAIINGDKFNRKIRVQNALAMSQQDTNAEENERRNADLRAALIQDAVYGRSNSRNADRSIYNWSSMKHYLGNGEGEAYVDLPELAHVDLDNAFDKSGAINPASIKPVIGRSVSYAKGATDLAFFEKDLINTIMGNDQKTSAYKNAWTHIGTLMHNAFERVHDPEKMENPDDAINDLRRAFLGETRSDEVDAILKTGLRFIPRKDGTLQAVNAPGTAKYTSNQLSGYTQHVNDLLSGSFGNILKVFDAYQKSEGETVTSIEDKLYDKSGKRMPVRYGGNIYRQIVTDEAGNVIRTDTGLEKGDFIPADESKGEKSHIFQTHAKPDEVRTMASGLKHIYDYKSGEEGSLESLPQSAFYASLFVDLAKKYHSLPAGDTRKSLYEPYKDWVKLDASGNPIIDKATGDFIPAVGLLTGISPKKAGSYDTIDLRTQAGMAWYKNRVVDQDKAFLAEEKRGQSNFNAGLQLLDDAKRKATEDVMSAERIATATKDNDAKAFEQRNSISKQSELYLATYAQNKERLKELESDIFKEHNRGNSAGYIPQDRFTRRRDELMQMFSVEQQAAMLMQYENEDAAREEIQKIGERRNLALKINEQDAYKASITDIDDAMTRVHRSLEGVKPSTGTSTVLGAYRAIREAGQTREHLKQDSTYYDKENDRFRTQDADPEVQRIAKEREKQYKASEDKSKEAEKFLANELDNYIAKYETKENKKIASLTSLVPEDPLTSFNNFVEKQRETLEKEISQYNENVKEYEETLKDKTLSEDQAMRLSTLRDIDQQHAQELQSFIDNGQFAAKVAQDRQRELGVITQTPQEKADRWRDDRIAAIDAELVAVQTQRKAGVLSDRDAAEQTRDLRQRRRKITDQAADMLGNEVLDRRMTLDSYEQTLTGNKRSNAEQAMFDRKSLYSKISEARNKLGTNDPLRAEYDALLDNYGLFDEYERNRRIELNTHSYLQAEASRRNHMNFRAQISGEELTPEEYANIQTSAFRTKNVARRAEIEKALRNQNLSDQERDALETERNDIDSIDYRTVRGRFLREGNQNQTIRNLQRNQKTASLNQLFTGVQSLDDAVDFAIDNAALQIEEAIKSLKLNRNQAATFRRRFSNTEKIREEATEDYNLMLRGEEVSNAQDELSISERLTGRRSTPDEKANIAILAMRRDIANRRKALLRQARRRNASEDELQAIRDQWNPEMDLTDYQNRITQQEQFAYQSFTAKQEDERLKLTSQLNNRNLTRDEYTRSTQARLRAERDSYLQQQLQNGLMTQAEANAYAAHYNDPYLLGIAQQQTNYEYTQRELALGMESRQIEATLSGRSMTRDELVQQRQDQLLRQAREHAEKLRRERGQQAYNDFWARNSYLDIMREAAQQVNNEFLYGDQANQNQLYAHQIQNDAALRQQGYSAQDFLRQQRNRHIRSAVLSSLIPYRERSISLSRNIQNFEDQKSIAMREREAINERLRDNRLSESDRAKFETQRDLKTQDIDKYNQQISNARSEMQSLNSIGTQASAVFMSFGDVIGRLTQRLGRRLFMKATQEAKRFVQEFNKSMTSIQMITLKSDSQMSTLGDGLIAKAKELKISVSEITQSAETLYRQGLSDEEVNERLDVISKFSKVSGTKVDAATKLITVAMNTGLVSDSQTAADIVTALGDNAATNAAEIEKGIEKAGAAAAADGTTFGQLAAMLTAITSTTQIGGNVAGRTLNTIFGRMNKIGTNELIYDENGYAISGSAVAQLLSAQGIKMYDENGNKRSSYDTLYALSQKWDSLSDAEQQQLANAIASTRQYSNFSAIMQGMSEGKVDEYMDLLGESSGITNRKYEVYVKSLQASLTNLKNTFDELINDLTKSGTITGVLDFFTKMIQGVDNLTNSMSGLGSMLTTVLPMIVGLAMIKSGNGYVMAAGAALTAISGITAYVAGNQKSATQEFNERKQQLESDRSSLSTTVTNFKGLASKQNLTDEEKAQLKSYVGELANYTGLDTTSDSFKTLISAIENTGTAAVTASSKLKNYAETIEKEANNKNEQKRIQDLSYVYSDFGKVTKEKENNAEENVEDQVRLDNPLINKHFKMGENKEVTSYKDRFSQYYIKGEDGSYSFDINAPGYKELEQEFLDKYGSWENYNKELQSNSLSYTTSRQDFLDNIDIFDIIFGGEQDVLGLLFKNAYRSLNPQELTEEDIKLGRDKWDSNKWADVIKWQAMNKWTDNGVTDHVLDVVNNYLNGLNDVFNPSSSIQTETRLSSYREALKDFFPDIDEDEINSLVPYMDSIYHSAYNGSDTEEYALDLALNSVIGNEAYRTPESILRHKEEALNAAGYEKKEEAQKEILTPVGQNGYYYDNLKQEYITAQEAENRIANGSAKAADFTAYENRFVNALNYSGTEGWKTKNQKAIDADYLTSVLATGAYKQEGVNPLTAFMRYVNENNAAKAAWNTISTSDAVNRILNRGTYNTETLEYEGSDALMGELARAVQEESATYGSSYVSAQEKGRLATDAFLGLTKGYMSESLLDEEWEKYKNENKVDEFKARLEAVDALPISQDEKQQRKAELRERYNNPILDKYVFRNSNASKWFISEDQKKTMQENAWQEYRKEHNLDEYEREIQEIEESSRPAKYKATAKKSVKDKYGITTKEEFLAQDVSKWNAETMSEEQAKYLKEILGEQMYDRILAVNNGGEPLTDVEKIYIDQLLDTYSNGGTSLTKQQQVTGMTAVGASIKQGEFKRSAATDQYMSGWSDWNDYATLVEKRQNSSLTDQEADVLKNLEQRFENYTKDFKINFDIEGLKDLEEADKILEGTSKYVEALKKGENFRIKGQIQFESNLFDQRQQKALLENGTYSEQVQIIMDKTGRSKKEVEQDFAGTRQEALEQIEHDNEVAIEGLNRARTEALKIGKADYVDNSAAVFGYKYHEGMSTEDALDEIREAYDDQNIQYDERLNKLYKYDDEGNRIYADTDAFSGRHTQDYFDSLVYDGYISDNSDNKAVRESLFGDKTRAYSATEILEAQEKMLNGQEEEVPYDLQKIAASSMGTYSQSYMAMEADQTGTYSDEVKRAEKEKALKEIEGRRESAAEEDALKEAELNNLSLGGMFNYLQVQHSQQNKASDAAEQIFGSLSGDNIKNFTDLANSVNGSQADNWKKLLEATPDLANKLSQLGATVDSSGNIDFSKVEKSGYNLADVLSLLSSAAANAAENIENYNVESTGDKYRKAMDYLNGEVVTDEQEAHDILASIFGNEQIANVVANNRSNYEAETNAAAARRGVHFENGNAYSATGELIGTEAEWRAGNGSYDKYKGLTDYNRRYAEIREENAESGQPDLTDVQRADFLQEIIDAANRRLPADQEGSLGYLRKADEVNAWDDITSGIEGMDKWLAASERLNEVGLSMSDLSGLEENSEMWQVATEAVEDYYGSVTGAVEAQENMDAQLASTSIRLSRMYGNQTDAVANRMDQLSGSIQEQDEAISAITTNWDNYNKAVYVRNQFQNGSTDWSDVTSILGGSDNLWKNTDRDTVLAKLNAKVEVNEQEVINDTNAQLNTILSQISETDIEQLSPIIAQMTPTMTWDVSTLSTLAEQLGVATNSIIQDLIETMTDTNATVIFDAQIGEDGKSIEITADTTGVTATNSGSGYSGGSSGSGDSEVDELTKKLSFYETEKKHVVTMLQTKETSLNFTNNYEGLHQNLDEQIEAQNALAEQYVSNIEDLTDQLDSVDEYSDDWYTLTEAIMEAEESLEEVNNEIDSINAKRITIVEEKQTEEDKPISHRLTMLSKYASKYQTLDNFESYSAVMNKTISATQDEINQNNSQIAEWESLLATYTKDTDSWREVRDKIWALKEENAELENTMASDRISLSEATISQIATDLENEQRAWTHANSVLGTVGGMYQSTENQAKYRETLEATNKNNQSLIDTTDAAIKKIKEEIEAMEEDDVARKTAITTLYQLEETRAQYEASVLSNRAALEETYSKEIEFNHKDNLDVLEHEKKLLEEQAKEYSRNQDFVNYEMILGEEARNAAERLKEQTEVLSDYIELQNSGNITKDSQQWRDLEATIRSTKETIASLTNEYEELLEKAGEAKFTTLQQAFTDQDDLLTHEIKLIQYEETKYQNNKQLTNYGTMLTAETTRQEERKALIEQYIKDLKEQRDAVDENDMPDLYNKLDKEVRKYEEQLSTVNNTIEKNNKLIKQNAENIRKARQTVENAIDKEIRHRIQNERDMLAATVQTENAILEVIRKNYRDQWNLEKQAIQKKKDALNEEKSLIDERLNYRKEAINKEEKMEELAEYQRQLALISADTTRTKDQAELKRKIADIQKELALEVAEDEANAEKQALTDKAEAWDDYIATQEEDLNELLENANNFRDKLDEILEGSFDAFVDWMKENNEDYKNATDETREQMVQGWEDTWKKMKHELDTYWEEVGDTMATREGFLEFLKNSDEFLTASGEYDSKTGEWTGGKGSFLYQWGEWYDDYTASLIDNASFDDTHKILDTVQSMKDWTFNVIDLGLEDYLATSGFSDYIYNRDSTTKEVTEDTDYKDVGKTATTTTTSSSGGSSSSSSSSSDSGSGSEDTTPAPTKKEEVEHGFNFTYNNYQSSGHGKWTTKADAEKTAKQEITNLYNSEIKSIENRYKSKEITYWKYIGELTKAASHKTQALENLQAYSEGGYVNYTGLAAVHGTPSRPEAFLDATDTELLRNMLDAFNYVKVNPYMTHIDQSMFGNSGVSVGDINVNLYEAKLENDTDYDVIAQKVGKAFTKQLQKDGFNLANYAW